LIYQVHITSKAVVIALLVTSNSIILIWITLGRNRRWK